MSGHHRLSLAGALDFDAEPAFRSTVSRLCVDGAQEIELDLRGLTSIAPSGLRAILRAQSLCAEHDCDLVLVASPQSAIHSPFESAGIVHRLHWRELPDADRRAS